MTWEVAHLMTIIYVYYVYDYEIKILLIQNILYLLVSTGWGKMFGYTCFFNYAQKKIENGDLF